MSSVTTTLFFLLGPLTARSQLTPAAVVLHRSFFSPAVHSKFPGGGSPSARVRAFKSPQGLGDGEKAHLVT